MGGEVVPADTAAVPPAAWAGAFPTEVVPLSGPGGYRVKFRPGTKDEPCLGEVLRKEVYRSSAHGVCVEPGDKWIDLGSHIGIFAFYAFQRGAAKVWCYEPGQCNLTLLRDNLEDLNKVDVEIHAAAVAAVSGGGKATLYMPKDPKSTWRPRMEPHEGKRAGGPTEEVDIVSFQDVLDAHPEATAMKIDIEGSETRILATPGINWHQVRKLVFEYTRKKDCLAKIKQNLMEQGWKIEYDPEAEINDGTDTNDPIIFATRPESQGEVHDLEVPAHDLRRDRGQLLKKLVEGRGIVRVTGLPPMQFGRWKWEHSRFVKDPSLANKDLVKLSCNQEQLACTVQPTADGIPHGQRQAGPSDADVELRTNFDVKRAVLHSDDKTKDYSFFRREYESFSGLLDRCLKEELEASAPDSSLSRSSMSKSILRHCLYPGGGRCGGHSDYGLKAFIQTTQPGLQVWRDGAWRTVPRTGCDYLGFAGDMMEIVTSGLVPAVLHRVVDIPTAGMHCDSALQIARQSGLFFVQPSDDDKVECSLGFRSKFRSVAEGMRLDFRDYEAVRYGDWHDKKKMAAFRHAASDAA